MLTRNLTPGTVVTTEYGDFKILTAPTPTGAHGRYGFKALSLSDDCIQNHLAQPDFEWSTI